MRGTLCRSRSTGAVAAGLGARTLAFPSISTGVYGYPIALAAPVALASVRAHVSRVPVIEEVVFCCFSADDHAVYEALLAVP